MAKAEYLQVRENHLAHKRRNSYHHKRLSATYQEIAAEGLDYAWKS